MISGVYIGQAATGDYDIVSTGDYINPISPTFRLKDQKKSIQKILPLYLIINNIDLEFIKVSVSGAMSTIRCYLSWDQKEWFSEIQHAIAINALNQTQTKPFYLKIVVDDFLEYFSLTGENAYKQYKLQLIYV